MISVVLMAFSLAMDAFAVSVSCGLTVAGFSFRHALMMGAYFGAFQFIMPLAGWLLGESLVSYIADFSPYIAFLLLAFIGGRMLVCALGRSNDNCPVCGTLTHRRLFGLAVATSVDALAAGFSFSMIEVNVFLSCTIIGGVAFFMSVLGGKLGKRLGGLFQSQAEIFGGITLIGIGLKILLDAVL